MQELAILGGRSLHVKPYPPYNTIGQEEKILLSKFWTAVLGSCRPVYRLKYYNGGLCCHI